MFGKGLTLIVESLAAEDIIFEMGMALEKLDKSK